MFAAPIVQMLLDRKCPVIGRQKKKLNPHLSTEEKSLANRMEANVTCPRGTRQIGKSWGPVIPVTCHGPVIGEKALLEQLLLHLIPWAYVGLSQFMVDFGCVV